MTAPVATIDLVYFNAGGGHRAAAQALQAAIALQGLPWQVRLLNLVEVLDPQDRFRRVTGMAPEDLYNKRLARGWTLGLAQELKLLQGLIRLGHEAMVRRLARHWSASLPTLVVSLVPNFNRALADGLAQALPGVPLMTVMTDMADHPPHFWIEPTVQQHLVCGTARAVDQARAAGVPAERLHRVSGMVLRPEFHTPLALDRAAERRALGLPADAAVGLVLFGGQGSRTMLGIARRLPDTPLILLCGHNTALAAQLRRQPAPAARVVLGYTPEVRRYMALADFFVGKPGPGSLSEAVQQGLPVVTVRNAFTMPQERYNTLWVEELGLGRVLPGFGDIATAVAALGADLPACRQRVAAVRNRAVFEVVALIARLLQQTAAARRTAAVAMGEPA